MSESKYAAQAKHIKENYVPFKINFKPELLSTFKEKCKQNGTTPTTEIKKFVKAYCDEK